MGRGRQRLALVAAFALSACGVDQDLGQRPRLDASTDATSADVVAGDADAGVDGSAPSTASRLATGLVHSCAIVVGKVKCWGRNDGGQLGVGDTVQRGSAPGQMGAALPSVDLGQGAIAVALSAGYGHTCALLDDGRVKCWGSNAFGELGVDDTKNRGDLPGTMGDALPAVALGAKARALALGARHSCALLVDGRVKCWGINTYGQLGLGDTKDRGGGSPPMASIGAVDLGAGRTAKAIAADAQDTCVILDDDSLKCFGFNVDGELGIGTVDGRGDAPGEMGDALPRVDVGPGRTVREIAMGGLHACALLDDATVRCWGANSAGSLGLGDPFPRGGKPSDMGTGLAAADLGPGRTAKHVFASTASTCAILDDSSLKCWGRNEHGQLGLGDTAARGDGSGEMGAALPTVALAPGRTVLSLSTTEAHVCAALDDGRVQCWGSNDRGQLGLGDVADRGDGPSEMGAALPFVSLGP